MPPIIFRAEALTLGLTQYFTGRPCKHGHIAERYTPSGICKSCSVDKSRAYKEANLEKIRENERKRHAQLSAHPFSPKNSLRIARYIFRKARSSAKKRGIEFSLTLQDFLPLPVYCPVLGYELVYRASRDSRGHMLPNHASSDRIDNTRGYVPGNVQIISYRANVLKRDATAVELRAILDYCEMHEAFPF